MKIAAISASRIPSTAANSIQVMKACHALAKAGHEITLFVPRHAGSQMDLQALSELYGVKANFPVIHLPAFSIFHRHDFAWLAALRARNMAVDLVVAWPLQAALASISFGCPTILEMHGPPEGRFGPSMFRLFLARPGKKRLVLITQALFQMIERAYPDLDIASISRIAPNGVDLERYADLPGPASARQSLGLPDRLTAVYSGHLYPGRGMGMLLELAGRFPEVQFLWIGGRPEDVSHWREQLRIFSVSNVNLIGFVPNDRLPLIQAAADIFLMPYEQVITGSSGGNSAGYASPMKMFEYMACQRPVLASDLPVIREVLNKDNAVLCPPEDVNAWTDSFRMLLESETFRTRLAQQAYQDVQALSWDIRAQKILAGFIDEFPE